MMRSVVLPSSWSFVVEPKNDLLVPPDCPRSRVGGAWTVCCYSKRNPYVKVDHLNKTKTILDTFFENLPLVQKTQNEISDYCVTLEGEPCCDCWEAYFKLGELESLAPKAEVERLIWGANGVEDLIDSLHRISEIYRNKKETNVSTKAVKEEKSAEPQPPPYVPEWLPKSAQELEEEERARMNDSVHTRLLRVMGRSGRTE